MSESKRTESPPVNENSMTKGTNGSKGPGATLKPTWDDDIMKLLAEPFWLPEKKRADVGKDWRGAMLHYGSPTPPDSGKYLDLANYDHVKYQAKTIYEHCASRSMPITKNECEYWPDEALLLFKTWVNQGCRKSQSDPIIESMVIASQLPSRKPIYRVRKDIRDLTPKEVQIFRAKIQDVLQPELLDSKWQKNGELHAWWCLHYQEGTFFWHRAWLMYVEEQIGFPIPYWNTFSKEAADPESPYAGIPSIFLEDTYVHPDGSTRPNPLKFALAYRGLSYNKKSKYVQRDPVLVAGRPPQPGPEMDKWNKKISWQIGFKKELDTAMSMNYFSAPQDEGAAWGTNWAFTTNPYVCQMSFDGYYEQVHDELHAWIGGEHGDMLDNTYTAFDPVFLPFHCNLDRVFNQYLMNHPNLQLSSNFPLRPFTNMAKTTDETDPLSWAYTSIGDLGKNTQALGYLYAPAAGVTIAPNTHLKRPMSSKPRGGKPIAFFPQPPSSPEDPAAVAKTPLIVFDQVRCTTDSFIIDVFLKGAASMDPHPVDNPDFVGRLFRFGMGRPHDRERVENTSRCKRPAVTRVLDAERVKDRIADGFVQVVKRPGQEEPVPEKEWSTWDGFKGELVWMVVEK